MSPLPPPAEAPEKLRALLRGLAIRGVCVLHQTPDHRFDIAENAPAAWPVTDLVGRQEADVFPSPVARLIRESHDQVTRSGEPRTVEFEIGEGLRRHLYEMELQRDETGVLIVVADVTETRRREAAVTALLREVSHRSKNLLAIVQSVAMQTANHSRTIQDFLDKFRGRLHALSSTQDLVTESDWRGTYLHALVTAQLARVGSSQLAHVCITGANPLLGPNASLHVGLAMHELGANAVLHGALAENARGEVRIEARIADSPDQPADLIIEWIEVGVGVAEGGLRPRFGTLVLERIVPLSVGGTAQFQVMPESVHYRLVVPADQFEV
jgi:two-component sensor histidine kinase